MNELTKQQKSEIFSRIDLAFPEDWWKIGVLHKEDYFYDFCTAGLNLNDDQKNDFIEIYFNHAGSIVENIFTNSGALRLTDYIGPKRFAGLEKASLEIDYRNYLKSNFFSELIEFTVILAFIGHEYEVFKLEMIAHDPNPGLLTKIFWPSRYEALRKIPNLTRCLENLYNTVLSPQPPLDLLKYQLNLALEEKCYVNPCVFIALERSEDAGLKRFKCRS